MSKNISGILKTSIGGNVGLYLNQSLPLRFTISIGKDFRKFYGNRCWFG